MSDSEESYEVINYSEVHETAESPKQAEKSKEPECKPEVTPTISEKKPEEEEKKKSDSKPEEEEMKSEKDPQVQAPTKNIKKNLCQRICKFLKEVERDELKTVFVVAKSLLQNGSSFENAIITAINVSDSVSKFDLVQDLLQVLPVYAPKIQGWVPVLLNLNFEAIFTLLPTLAAQAASNNQRCEVDIRPLLRTMCPNKIRELESKLPNNVCRDFNVDPKNITGVLKTAEDSLNKEFPQKVKHNDVICDLCEETPVGKRYKCTVCPNFDLCEKCVDKHDIQHPLIQLRLPVNQQTPNCFVGLHEFVRSTNRFPGFGRGRFGCRGRGFGRRGGFGRRCPFRGDPSSNPQSGFTGFFEKFDVPNSKDEILEKKEELKAKKQEIKCLKKEAKSMLKDLKHQKKDLKLQKKQLKKKFKLDVVVGRDCKIVEPGSEIYFKWVIKNIGNIDWNEGTNAVWLKGHKDLLPKDFTCLHVGDCKIDDRVEVIAKLHAPNACGDYNVYFAVKQGGTRNAIGKINARVQVKKLESQPIEIKEPAVVEENRSVQNGTALDQVVSSLDTQDLMVIADYNSDEPEEEEKLQDKPVSFKYKKQYDQIKSMGFSMDEEMLKAVLVANEGDLEKTLTVLMD